MSIIKNYRLRLDAGNITPLIIHVNQYDKNEIWNFTLIDYQGNQYITTEAAIVGKKPDGCLIVNNCTVSEGIVSVEVTEQMTAAAGKAVFELLVDGQMHGTANFVVLIERSPEDGAIESESDLSLFQQAIDATSTPAIIAGVQAWMDENLTPTTPVVDSSLSITGAAADAKKTGDEISELKSAISSITGVPIPVKRAMDTLFQNMAFDDDTGYETELSLIHAWATEVNLVSISATYRQSGEVYTTTSLDSLKSDLVVTASYSDSSSAVLPTTAYTLSGTLTEGTSYVTVTYEGKTTSFAVTVVERNWIIPNGTYTFATTGEVITVTNHNHFAITLSASASNNSSGNFINLSDLIKNGVSSVSSNNNIAVNNLSDVLYTFPANANATLKLLNPTVSRTDVIADVSKGQLVISFRKTGDSTTVIASGVGFPISSAGGGNKFENTVTIAEETEASCLFLYYVKSKDVTFEFDLEMTVNGEKVI